MCIQFKCTSCHHTFTDHCNNNPVDSNPITEPAAPTVSDTSTSTFNPLDIADTISTTTRLSHPQICPYLIQPTNSTSKLCETCTRICGTIQKLQTLIFQAPFLTTHGLSGLDNLATWEKKELETVLRGRKKDWQDEAESRGERHDVQRRIEKMGLDGVSDGREEHQGYAMDVTPPKDEVERSGGERGGERKVW